jgi:hypothetical protein
MIDKLVEDFLRVHTDGVRHSGRTLFEHLVGTYTLLTEQDAPDYVCLAGAFHSIYGTNIFTHQAMLIGERNKVRHLIGSEAERLAYIFCSCNRPMALVQAAKRGPPYEILNRRKNEIISLSDVDMFNLLKIEIANLEDQGGGQMLPDVRKALLIATGGRLRSA